MQNVNLIKYIIKMEKAGTKLVRLRRQQMLSSDNGAHLDIIHTYHDISQYSYYTYILCSGYFENGCCFHRLHG